MNEETIRLRLKEQGWRCAYLCGKDGRGDEITSGDALAHAYDNHGIVHLACAQIGRAPLTK